MTSAKGAARPTGHAPPTTLGERVHADILHLIVSTPMAIGTLLPSEAEFCRMFSVSRIVVRAALARLKDEGIIESRQGRGSTVVWRPNGAELSFPAAGDFTEIQKIYEFREVMEPGIAALAARNGTEAGITRIRDALETFHQAYASGETAIEEDLRFHLAIAEASQNSFFLAAISALSPHFVRSIELSRKLSRSAPGGSHAEAYEEHLAITHAIEAHDAAGAQAAMTHHLLRTRQRAFRGA